MRVVKGRKFNDTIDCHPCFSETAYGHYDILHLPVALECNIECRYCEPRCDCINDSAPGISSKVIGRVEALDLVKTGVERNTRLKVVAVSGPGEPLASPETFDVLRAVHRHFPFLTLCVSTNGLLLSDRIDKLVRSGVRSISITMNAAIPEVGERLYSRAFYQGSRYSGRAAADIISYNQWRGLRNAIDAGLAVRIKSMYIPGINDEEIPYIAWLAGRRGADVHHVVPFVPRGELAHLPVPPEDAIGSIREKSGKYMTQVTHCSQSGASDCMTGHTRAGKVDVLAHMTG